MYNSGCIFYDDVGRTPYTCNYFQENFNCDCSNCGKCITINSAYVVLRKYADRVQNDHNKNYMHLVRVEDGLLFTHIRGGDEKTDVKLRMSRDDVLKLCRQIESCTLSSQGDMTVSIGRYDVNLTTVNIHGLRVGVCIRSAGGLKSLGMWEYDGYSGDRLISSGVRAVISDILKFR